VSDTGVVKGDGWELTVEAVEKVDGRSAVVGTFGETFEPTPALAQVNEARRKNIERNHTATHLVHAALRKVLGAHVRQAGSVVAPERLRFDFSHHGPIADEQLGAIEAEVNAHIWENLPIETREMAYTDAVRAGAMALFGEKYGDRVRVVDVPGVSLELCGGTHVASTGQIALFRFTHETGAAAGVRRIEALTGPAAYRYAVELQHRLTGLRSCSRRSRSTWRAASRRCWRRTRSSRSRSVSCSRAEQGARSTERSSASAMWSCTWARAISTIGPRSGR
jgi:alanyl-tRNA synthetase